MRRSKLPHLIAMAALAGCASTGVVQTERDLYMIGKKHPAMSWGTSPTLKAEAYAEANEFCARDGRSVETVKLDEIGASFARSAGVELQFRCVKK
jgi:hypothetical protein